MSTVSFRTMIYDSPGTPLGLLGRTQRIVHRCNECGAEVTTGKLAAHARAHGEPTRWWEVDQEGGAID
jgi:hypothetical protein